MNRRWALAVLGVATLGFAALAATGLRQGLVYYRTPSEAASSVDAGTQVRVGGMVASGSVVRSSTTTRMVLTDGAADITVVFHGEVPDMLGERRGAVAEGVLRADGVLLADRILVRHSNEYQPPKGPANP